MIYTNVQVATAGNIEISADAVNWKTSITNEELLEGIHSTYAGAINQIPSNGIYPMSTAGNINNGRMDMFFGEVKLNNETSTYTLKANKEADAHGDTGKYIVFDIFLKVVDDTTIHINSNSNIISESIKDNRSSTGVENATRIAFLKEGTASNAADSQRLKGATEAIIVEPNYDVHTISGIKNAQNLYGITGLDLSGNRLRNKE